MTAGARRQATYFPDVFNVRDIEHAKRVILTDEGSGADTNARWTIETPYVMELIAGALALRRDMIVLDYGCGIGRLAKAIIEAFGCCVVGVDISASMRELAAAYVGSEQFVVLAPVQFDALVRGGLRVNAAIAVWVLQHCFAPADDIARIGRSLAPDGRMFVLNMPKRAVPAVLEGKSAEHGFVWALDGIDVTALLRGAFRVEAEGEPDKSRTPNMADAGAYWMSLRLRRGT
jgi:SAM-dependent methyltransferase